MADKKFSDFTTNANLSAYTGLVGFDAGDNYFITPAELNTSLESTLDLSNFNTGTLPAARGGTGITNFSDADFANANVNYSTDGVGALPIAKGGTGTNTTAYASLDDTFGGRNVYGTLGIDNGGTNATTQADALDNITDAQNQVEFDVLSVRGNAAVFRKQTICCKVTINGTAGLSNTNNGVDFLVPYNTQAVNDDATVYAPVLTGTGQGSVQVLESGRYFIKVIYATFDLTQTALPSVQGNKFMRITVATDTAAAGLGTKQVLLDDIIVPTSGNGEATIEGEAILDLNASDYIKIIGFHDGALDTGGNPRGFPVNNNTLFNQPSLWICKIA